MNLFFQNNKNETLPFFTTHNEMVLCFLAHMKSFGSSKFTLIRNIFIAITKVFNTRRVTQNVNLMKSVTKWRAVRETAVWGTTRNSAFWGIFWRQKMSFHIRETLLINSIWLH